MDMNVEHKFLLSYGQNQKVGKVNGDAGGATKRGIREAAEDIFALEGKPLILQSFDKEFEDYVDIEEDDKISGPTKIRVKVEEPVVFPVTINVSHDDMEQIGIGNGSTDACSDGALPDESSEDDTDNSMEDATESIPTDDTQSTSASVSPPASAPVSPSPSTPASPSASAPVSASSSGSSPSNVGWITRFTVPVQPASITTKLKSGGDTLKTSELGIFLDSIYTVITKEHGVYYPTRMEYDMIIDKIFRKFPVMMKPGDNMPLGDKKKLWKHRLQYKFQNRRKRGDTTIEAVKSKKLKTPRKPVNPPPAVVRPPTYWGMKNYLPNRPASEDDQTIEKNVTWLQAEWRKKQPDFKTVSCLMDKTLADRRKWIVSSQPQPTTEEVQARYPWLFNEDQLSEEMERIKGDAVPLAKHLSAGLTKYCTALLKKAQGKRTPHRFFQEIITAIPLYQAEKDREGARLEAAFLSIPGLFQERITDIFVPIGKTTDNSTGSHLCMDAATPFQSRRFTLIVHGARVAHSCTILGAATAWIEAFYVLNLGYPTCVQKSLTFIQQMVLDIDSKLPMSKTMRMKVNELNAAQCAVAK